jgi:hypothetical protein
MVEKPAETGDKSSGRMKDEAQKKAGFKKFGQWNAQGRAYKKPAILQPKFEGKCADLKGHIYDCTDSRQADIFTKTTKEIAEYVGTSYKYGSDTRLAVYSLKATVLEKPDPPEDADDEGDKRIWEKEIDEYVREKKCLKENLKTLYSLVWGQCSDVIRTRIEALDNHEEMSLKGDSIGLLQAIKGIVYNFQSEKYRPMAIHEAMRRFYMIYQDKYMTCGAYLEKF